MKKVFTLALSTLALALFAAQVPAMAQGARFEYEPNRWEKEKPRMPKHFLGPQHNVSPGMVPKGNMLGLDKSFMAKPKPNFVPSSNPFIKPTVAARPMPRQTVNGHYDSKFGNPVSPPAALVANQPKQLPDFGSPRALTAPQAQPMPAAPSTNAEKNVNAQLANPQKVAHHPQRAKANRLRSRESVSGKLRTPPHQVAHVAVPKSYNNSKFFETGGFTPKSTSTGTSSRADVYGTVIRKH